MPNWRMIPSIGARAQARMPGASVSPPYERDTAGTVLSLRRPNNTAASEARSRYHFPMDHLTGTRIRREATPATVNLRRCKLVVIKGAQRGTEFVIAGDVLRVGKAPDANDLVLGDETVS